MAMAVPDFSSRRCKAPSSSRPIHNPTANPRSITATVNGSWIHRSKSQTKVSGANTLDPRVIVARVRNGPMAINEAPANARTTTQTTISSLERLARYTGMARPSLARNP